MTALSRYARLESTGRWRAAPGEVGREVVVSFGHATLVLADGSGLPLAHWSLPAVTRLNPGTRPALYGPDEAGSETLEIDDEIMVSAIETVRRSVARARSGPHRLRRALGPTLAVLGLFLGFVWFPGAVRRESLDVVPLSKRTEIGATLLGHLQASLGPACRDPRGTEALQRLHDRALGQGGHAVVLPLGPRAPLVLPGHITVLSRDLVERAAEPAVVAGHLLAAQAALDGDDPLGLLLDEVGVWATLRLLVTGNLDPAALETEAATLLGHALPEPDADVLGPAFAQAEVPLAPWALDLDPTGESVGDLLAADAYPAGEAPILISDSEWVALQGICQGN